MTTALVVAAIVGIAAVWWLHRWRRDVVARLTALGNQLGAVDTAPPSTVDDALALLTRVVEQSDERARRSGLALDRLVATLDLLPFPVVVGDPSGEVVHRNPAAVLEDEVARTGPIVSAALREALTDAAAGRAADRPLRLFGPPRRRLQVIARPLLSEGEVVGVGAVLVDHSELERVDEIRRDFVANLSHELKTPVGALSLLAETLLEEDEPDVRDRLLERTHVEAHRMSRIIDDLLELAELEAGGELPARPVRVADVAAEAADQVAGAAERHRSKVLLGDVGDEVVLGDQHLLVRAVVNLLENAMKYSGEGAEVLIDTERGDDVVDLRVTDEGIGIPAKHLDRIFERFYRVDRARSRASGGTGLGLSIVRHTVERHGGEVLVESREGVGSTFTLRLPLAPAGPELSGGVP